MKDNPGMSLEALLIKRAELSQPLSEEYIEQRCREVFGDPGEFADSLKKRLDGAIKQVIKEIA